MGRPKKIRSNIETGVIDYPKLYAVLKQEDEYTRKLYSEANDKITLLASENAELKAQLVNTKRLKEEAEQVQVELRSNLVKLENKYSNHAKEIELLRQKNRILLANYNARRPKKK